VDDNEDLLRDDLQESLRAQGFIINEQEKLATVTTSKDEMRRIQKIAKMNTIKKHEKFIIGNLEKVRNHLQNGNDIDPNRISLSIRPVLSQSFDELLFRWWNLVWWSMPYQRPYGRQMRFIIWDTTHDAPFGLISLQSPILKQAVRDKYLEIPTGELDYWVNRSMYAQRVGALPPYNELIGGKMVALALTSNEIKNAYQEKYLNKKTLMAEREIESDLLFITTTSAFGRSSQYNRLKYGDDLVAEKIGYTKGYGSFQIPDDLYERLIDYLKSIGENADRGYGNGPSRKLKLISLACKKLDLADYSYHGIKREYYLISLVENLKKIISEQAPSIVKNYTFNNLFDYWKERWMKDRITSNEQWQNFSVDTYLNNITEMYQTKT